MTRSLAILPMLVLLVGCGLEGLDLSGPIVDEELLIGDVDRFSGWQVDPATDGIVLGTVANDREVGQCLQPPWTEPTFDGGPHQRGLPLSLDRDGRRIAKLKTNMDWRNAHVYVVDRETGENLLDGLPPSHAAALSNAGDRLALAVPGTLLTRVYDVDSKEVLTERPVVAAGSRPHAMVWHPDDEALVLAQHGKLVLIRVEDWRVFELATPERSQSEWEAKARVGQEETGFHPFENVMGALFIRGGTHLVLMMDRGLRLYDWQEVLDAGNRLPEPLIAVDSELVHLSWMTMRMTNAAAYDDERDLVLFGGLEGAIRSLDPTTAEVRTLWRFPTGANITQLALVDGGRVLCCEVASLGNAVMPVRLLLLDYEKLLRRAVDSSAPAIH